MFVSWDCIMQQWCSVYFLSRSPSSLQTSLQTQQNELRFASMLHLTVTWDPPRALC